MPLRQIAGAVANRIKRGLYAGRRVLFGNNVSENGGNRTRRKWLPNVQKKRMYSEQLDAMVPLRLTTGAMRNIDKAGGLDPYLFKIQDTREDSSQAVKLRAQIKQHSSAQRRLQREAETAARRAEKARLAAARTTLLPPAAAVLQEPSNRAVDGPEDASPSRN